MSPPFTPLVTALFWKSSSPHFLKWYVPLRFSFFCFFHKGGPGAWLKKGGWKKWRRWMAGQRGESELQREETLEGKRDGKRELRLIKRREGRRTAGCLAVGVDHPSAKCWAKRGWRHREGECKLVSWEELKIKGCSLVSAWVLKQLPDGEC